MSDIVPDDQVDEAPKVDNPKGGEAPKTFTQAEVDRIVGDRLTRESAKYADYDDIKAKATQFDAIKEGEKTELQKAVERAEAAEKAAKSELRGRIAATKGVPVGSLVGETEEELTAKADELLAWKGEGGKPDPKPAPKRNPAGSGGGLKSGATGGGGDAIDPKEAAAKALRELRGNA